MRGQTLAWASIQECPSTPLHALGEALEHDCQLGGKRHLAAQHDLEGTLRHGPLSDAGRHVPSTHRNRTYDDDHSGSAKLKEMPDDALRPQVGRASALAGSSGSDASRTGVAE